MKKIVFIFTMILLFVVSISSKAETSYKTVEINRELHLFGSYLDSLSPNEAIEGIKRIGVTDEKWLASLRKFPNKITSTHYSESGSVVLKNNEFHFQIVFTAEIQKSEQIWSCKIEDKNLFFKPKQCINWIKKIKIIK
jgi:hypothetical protein